MSARRLAKFTDGETAQEHAVVVDISPSYLRFEAAGRTHLWLAEGLRLQDMIDGAPRMAHRDAGEARLYFAEKSATADLKAALPEAFAKRRDGWRREARQIGMFLGILLVVAGSIYVSLPLIARTVTAAIPMSYEKELGRSVLNSVGDLISGADLRCNGYAGNRALLALQHIFTEQQELDVPIQVFVVPVSQVNAIALPGGHILIFEGLLREAESADEVAAVLAHEIGHVQYRHGMQALVRSHTLQLLVSLLAPGGGDLGSGAAALALNLSHTRDAEREADAYALEQLNAHGISSLGFAAFFNRLQRQLDQMGHDAPPPLLSSHPPTEERIALIERNQSKPGRALNPEDWEDLREICKFTKPIFQPPLPTWMK